MKFSLFTIIFIVLSAGRSQSNDRKPLIEVFSSSTCETCAEYGSGQLGPFLNNPANNGKYTMVNYRSDWPDNGDNYFTEEVAARILYYKVHKVGVPYSIVDAEGDSNFELQKAFDSAAAKSANVTIESKYVIKGAKKTDGKVIVKTKITPNQTCTGAVVHAAVCEKMTTGNVGANGESTFYHVMMKMVPDSGGTAVTLTAHTPVTIIDSAALAGTHIEEMGDLEVVVWVQIKKTKEILQSALAGKGITGLDGAKR